MGDPFVSRENKYNLRNLQTLKSLHKRTVPFGTEAMKLYGT